MVDFNTLTAIISLFILLLAGYGFKKVGVLKKEDSSVVGNIILYMAMPSFIFITVHGKQLTSEIMKASLTIIFIELFVLTLAYFIGRGLKLKRNMLGTFMLVCVFGNTGFLGFPMIMAAFDGNRDALFSAVIMDQFALVFILMSVGVAVAMNFSEEKSSKSNILQFLKTPFIYYIFVALLLKDVPIPQVIMKAFEYMAASIIPLAMLSIGMGLSTGSVKNYIKPILAVICLKMALMPIMAYYLLPMIGVTGLVQQVAVLECAVPSGVLGGVISNRYGGDAAFSASAIFVTTLLSIFALPFVFTLIT